MTAGSYNDHILAPQVRSWQFECHVLTDTTIHRRCDRQGSLHTAAHVQVSLPRSPRPHSPLAPVSQQHALEAWIAKRVRALLAADDNAKLALAGLATNQTDQGAAVAEVEDIDETR